MKNLVSNFCSIVKYKSKKWYDLLKKVFEILGAILSVCKMLDYLIPNVSFFSDIFESNFVLILSSVFLFCLILELSKRNISSSKIKNTDSKITLRIGRIEDVKTAIAFSTNTSFVTSMENEIISLNSAQGAFENKYYKDLSELDKQLKCSLKKCNYIKIKTINKKRYKTYKPGTVAEIHNHNRNIYFIAGCDINGKGKTINDDDNFIYSSLNGFWDYLIKYGHVENKLTMTLIGSGRAGISSITREDAIKIIVDSYLGIIRNTNHKIVEELCILIHPNDIEKINIDEVCKYIEYNSKYEYNAKSSDIYKSIGI